MHTIVPKSRSRGVGLCGLAATPATPSIAPQTDNRAPASVYDFALNSPSRLALPIAVHPGAVLTGHRVRDLVTNPTAQYEAVSALQARYQTRVVLTAMDLSVEAEAFGCQINMPEDEVPTVTGRRVTTLAEARALTVPQPGHGRTGVYLETARLLARRPERLLVLGGVIGPFSLAARLTGVSEACELTATEPELMHAVLEKSAEMLTAYVSAFKAAGAAGVIMAEPAAGLLSPRSLAVFSSAYVRQIAAAVEDAGFNIVLHNCAARLLHLPAVLESGVKMCHFGAPMDIVGALAKAPKEVILCGNLDPTGMFAQKSATELAQCVHNLLEATAAHPNFVISSGCDLPAAAPLANLDAFYQAVAAYSGHDHPHA